MGFLAPLWLLAALAVAMPIVLHLRHRTPPRVIRVGSLTGLVGHPAADRRRRLDDPWLLLLRAAMLVVLALLLAAPRLDDQRVRGRTIAVVPADLAPLRDSLRTAGVALADLPAGRAPWALAASAEAALGPRDTILLALPADADRYAPTRPRLRHAVWPLPVAGAAPTVRAPVSVTWRSASPRFDAARDSLRALTERIGAVVPLREAAGGRELVVGEAGTSPWSADGLRRGWLATAGAIDTLVDALLVDSLFLPSPADRVPSVDTIGRAAPPTRDPRALLWWLLVAMTVVERGIVLRRSR